MKTTVQTYPISAKREEIIKLITRHQVVCIVGPTGSGKSTQVPQYLLKEGYENIIVAVPTRMAATTLASRVSCELNSEPGEIVGYKTSFEKLEGRYINFCTDGYELMRRLFNDTGTEKDVLIIDELQEWGTSTEALLAFVKKKIDEGYMGKILLMSAFMDESVASFLGDAPIIRVEGSLYPIEQRTSADMLGAIVEMITQKRNTLVFVPGKHEIEETMFNLEKLGVNAKLIPLHAELSYEEQLLAFQRSSIPKIIVATNVAQTSITLPDIEAVVDSGLERRFKISPESGNIPTLSLGPISISDVIQRRGRAGRTKPGIYIYCGEKPIDKLEEYPTPDIYTSELAGVVLRMAVVGLDATKLEFFHQPPKVQLLAAQKKLRTLGAFDEDNHVTMIGDKMARLPVAVNYARMLIEAQKRGVLDEMITITAIQQCGGIKLQSAYYSSFTKEMTNDFLADLDCFKHLQKKLKESTYFCEYDSSLFDGFNKRNYYRINELRTKLTDVLYEIYGEWDNTGNRHDIALSCAAGLVEYLYVKGFNGWYANANDAMKRKIDKYSCIFRAPMVLALPRNIDLTGKVAEVEIQTLYLIHSAMIVSMKMLVDVAPQLFTEETIAHCNPLANEYAECTTLKFNENIIESIDSPISSIEEKRELLATWLAQSTLSKKIGVPPALQNILNKNKEKFSAQGVKSSNELYIKSKEFYQKRLQERALNSVPSMAKPKNFSMLEM